jgi:hypothetical protein
MKPMSNVQPAIVPALLVALSAGLSCVNGAATVKTGSAPPVYGGSVVGAASEQPLLLPASFESGLIVLRPATEDGVTLTMLLGSTERSFVRERKAKQLLPSLDQEATSLILPKMSWDAFIPPSRGEEGRVEIAERVDIAQSLPPEMDGVLGTGFLYDQTLTIDFANKQLLQRQPGEAPFGDSFERINLLPKPTAVVAEGEKPERRVFFLTIAIAGRPFEMLLDLAARHRLTDAQASVMGGKPGGRAGACFLSPAIFDELRAAHPEWQGIAADATSAAPALLVPDVRVANKQTGPAWFLREGERAVAVNEEATSERPVQAGRVSGACLSKLAFTVDFRSGLGVVNAPTLVSDQPIATPSSSAPLAAPIEP